MGHLAQCSARADKNLALGSYVKVSFLFCGGGGRNQMAAMAHGEPDARIRALRIVLPVLPRNAMVELQMAVEVETRP
jgi:hypothetical protein